MRIGFSGLREDRAVVNRAFKVLKPEIERRSLERKTLRCSTEVDGFGSPGINGDYATFEKDRENECLEVTYWHAASNERDRIKIPVSFEPRDNGRAKAKDPAYRTLVSRINMAFRRIAGQ